MTNVATTSGGVKLTLAEAIEWCASGIIPEVPYLKAMNRYGNVIEQYVALSPAEQTEWRRWNVSIWVGQVEVLPYGTSMGGEVIVLPRSAIGGRTYSAEETEQLLKDYVLVNIIIQSAIALKGND